MDRINGIIVHSGEWDRIYHAFNIAAVLASMGEETIVFLTYWALKNLCDGNEVFTCRKEEETIKEGKSRRIIKEIPQVVNLGKSFGKLRIIACSSSLELFGLSEEDLPGWVDKVGGLTEVIGADNIIFV
jgi:peroxiredoxin family protein